VYSSSLLGQRPSFCPDTPPSASIQVHVESQFTCLRLLCKLPWCCCSRSDRKSLSCPLSPSISLAQPISDPSGNIGNCPGLCIHSLLVLLSREDRIRTRQDHSASCVACAVLNLAIGNNPQCRLHRAYAAHLADPWSGCFDKMW
jgi:hypothetical protein